MTLLERMNLPLVDKFFRAPQARPQESAGISPREQIKNDAVALKATVLSRVGDIPQTAESARPSFRMDDGGNVIVINVHTDQVSGDVAIHYPREVGKGKKLHTERVTLILGEENLYATITDREFGTIRPFKMTSEELKQLSGKIEKGDIRPAQDHVPLSHEREVVDAA